MRHSGIATLVTVGALVIGCGSGGSSGSGTTSPARRISGTVSGATAAGVTVSLSGAATATAITSGSGEYFFDGVANGNYSIAPEKSGFTFSPIRRTVTVSDGTVSGQDFTAAAATYQISGSVSGAVAGGVTLTLTGAASASTTTDSSGNFSFAGLPSGVYTVTPSLAGGYGFTPPSRSVTVSGANVEEQTFVVAGAFAMSGVVAGAVSAGVTVTLAGARAAITTTDASGNFSFSGLPNGAYTVTPAFAGNYVFTPASRSVSVSDADVTGQTFTSAATYVISGAVSGAASGGVTVALTGAGSAITTTDAYGNYSFAGVVSGSYSVTPSLAGGYVFSPASRSVIVGGGNVAGQGFICAGAYAITGTISGAATAGVSVALTGALSGTTVTDSLGAYRFSGLANGAYTVTPSLGGGYVFTPAARSVTVNGANVDARDFTVAGAYSISGSVAGVRRAGASVTLSGTAAASTTADSAGAFTFRGLGNGTYTLVPGGNGCSFNPVSIAATVTGVPVALGQPFMCDVAMSTVSSGTGSRLVGIWGSAANDVWAVGYAGTILHWSGTAWSPVASGTTGNLSGVWGAGPSDIWVVGDAGTILHWNGSQWSTSASGTTNNLNAVWGAGANDVWAVGYAGTILHWDGASWSSRANGALGYGYLSGIWGAATGDVWIVADQGILHWNGSTWTPVTNPSGAPLYDIWGASSADVWAVGWTGRSGVTVHWDGSTWSTVPSGTTEGLFGVWGASSTDVWSVGFRGAVMHWNGSAWEGVASGTSEDVLSVWGSAAAGAVWAVGGAGVILRPADGQQQYTVSGTIRGAASSGVLLTLSGPRWGTANSDQSGNYTFAQLVPGTYSVTPTKPGFNFSARSLSVVLTSASAAGQDFTANVAGPGSLTLVNATPLWNIGSLVTSPGGGSNWGPNHLNGLVPPGGSVTLTNLPAGTWSFQAATQYGTSHWDLMNVYIDNASPYTWTLTEANAY